MNNYVTVNVSELKLTTYGYMRLFQIIDTVIMHIVQKHRSSSISENIQVIENIY